MQTGTIIHGTLLNYDLIEAFTTELEQQSVGSDDPRVKSLIIEGNEACAAGRDAVNYPGWADAEVYSDLIEYLMDKLTELAPDGIYFGSIEGDGSDFGYWTIEED